MAFGAVAPLGGCIYAGYLFNKELRQQHATHR
jgi:hypothetical protein